VEIDEAEEAELVSATVADLEAAFTPEERERRPEGVRVFTTTSPNWWVGDRTFGGMVVAQSLSAAMKTAPTGFEIHSLHGYFLRPVPPGSKTVHVVSGVRDGRSFATREVLSTTDGKETFRMTCSFHAPEEGDSYQVPMAAGVPTPSDIEGFEAPFPYDIRELGHTEQREDGTYLSTRRCWFRTREPLPDDAAVHACALAYFSDMTGASFRPGSIGSFGTHTDASLDHAIWFHRPWRADQWSFFDIEALVNAGGRATIRATMHGEDGTLHLSMAQELLIRKLEVPLTFDPPPWLARVHRDGAQGGDSSHGAA
jgi:acyl-CoA thioesterase-2